MGIFGLWRDEEEIIESARSVEKEIRIGFYVASRAAWRLLAVGSYLLGTQSMACVNSGVK